MTTNKLTLAIALLLPLACLAADDFKPLDIKPGLWETTITTQAKGIQPAPPEMMAKLTPEQRAQIEAAAKAKGGVGQQTRVMKSCLTADDLKKPFSLSDDAHACTRAVISSSGTKQEVHFECTKGPVSSSGEIHVEALSPESTKGGSQYTSRDSTHRMDAKVTFTARFLSADCGLFTKK
ncbi:MAG TPA: DUF3617 domain-containing protein [Bryobacteraceae bacterium]|nr:DUF3617 domain-containing protein [Bryobacteraceae bacterium]